MVKQNLNYSHRHLYFTLFLSIVASLSLSSARSARPAKITEVKTFGQGELRIIEGIPFLKLTGTYYEMGEQYGSLLKDQFQKIYQDLLPYKTALATNYPSDIQYQFEKLTSPKFIQQLKGMAAGSGLAYGDLLLGNYMAIIERGGCSSILAKIMDQDKKPGFLHGRNNDYGKGTGKYPVVVEYHPAGEFKHIAIGVVASAGLSEGMNERGITVSGNLAPGDLRNRRIQNASPDMKLREILSVASSLKDVGALMKDYACDVGNTFTIGSGDETDGVIFDVNYENVRKNHFQNSSAIFATNGFVHEDLNPDRDDLRYQIIERYVHGGKINSVDGMIEVLSDPGTSFGVNNPSTIHSVVFDPKSKTIYMAFNTTFAAWSQWLKYEWEKDLVTVYREADKEKIQNAEAAELREVHIIGAYWSGSLPVMGGGPRSHEPEFWIEIKEWLKEKNAEQLSVFRERAAKGITLKAKDKPDIKATITRGLIATEKFRGFMFKVDKADIPNLEPNIPYTIHVENTSAVYRWIVDHGVTLTKPAVK